LRRSVALPLLVVFYLCWAMFGFSQLDWLLASDDCLPIPLRPLGPQLSIAGLAMKFGHRALLVPAPAVNSYILIALARAAVDFAASASRCLRCFRVFCALCTPAFEPVLVSYFGFGPGVLPCRHGFRGRCFHMPPLPLPLVLVWGYSLWPPSYGLRALP